MRLIRLLLICLTLATALAAIFVAAAFVPAVQTWIVGQALARHPGLHASVGSVSAGFSTVHVSDLRLQRDGAVLTLPTLEARLPLKTALWDRRVLVHSLVAKGWTLDLSRQTAPLGEGKRVPAVASPPGESRPPAPAEAAPAETAVRVLRGLLGGWQLPFDAALDEVELEGDVLIPASRGKDSARVHVTLKGGGMAAGHRGEFALDAAGPLTDSRHPPGAFAVHGRLIVAMGSPRTIHRLELNGNLSSTAVALPDDLVLSARATAAGSAGAESYGLELSRADRHLATVAAGFRPETGRWEGTWRIDLRDTDFTRFYPGRALPPIATAGEGSFDADTACTRVHASGRLQAAISGLGVLAPALDRLGAVTLEAGFDLAHGGQSIAVDRLNVSVVGTHPIAVAQSRQPFSLDESTGAITVADPSADWLEGSLQGLPIAWLAGLIDGVEFSGGDATGAFVVKAADGGFSVRSTASLVADRVSIQKAGRMIGQDLDLSLTLLAESAPQGGWQMQGAPLTVSSAGRLLATLEAKVASPAGAGRSLTIAGTWKADLEALAAQPAIPGAGLIKGRTTTGDFSATVGTVLDAKGKLQIIGHDPSHILTASVRALVDSHGGVSFRAPVTIAFGSDVSDFSAEGTWSNGQAGPRVDADLGAVNVSLEHLGPLAASFAAAGGIALPEILRAGNNVPPTSVPVRDQHPFWGDAMGRVKFHCYRLRAGTHELNEVNGTFDFDHGAIRLERGRAVPVLQSPAADRTRPAAKQDPPRSQVTAEGSIAFDAAAELPYSIKATAAVDVVDAAELYAKAQGEHERVVDGRFSVVDTLTGEGVNLVDLVARRREEFRLVSNGGIIRLLKVNVAEAIPDPPTPVSDALASVGSALGSLLGIKRDPLSTGLNKLSKATEAVLNFSYQIPEIRYDQITVTATRGTDRTLLLTEVVMNSPNERLTGSGQITYVKGLPIRGQPLRLELRLGVRGQIAELLAPAGLLSSDHDEQGYIMLHEPVHFGGTLEQIDNSRWRDVLVKAATQKPDRRQKGG